MLFQVSEEVGSEPLYSKLQKVFVKSSSNEEIQREVRVTVDLTSSLSKVSKQTLHIQITDDEDPYFLYGLLITEEDYQQLRLSQGLLVDFHNFPGQVVRLLEQCNSDGASGQKFLLFLEEEKKTNSVCDPGKTYLKIVETNNFKHLYHLILMIEIGSDSDIKRLMMKKIKYLKERISKDESCINQMESQLQSQAKLLESKQHELNRIQQIWTEEKIAFRTETSKELSEETEKLRRSQLEWKIKIEKEMSDMEEKNQQILKEKESELCKLKIENQILSEKHFHTENSIKDQTKRIEGLEKELTSVKWELNTARKQSAKLDLDYHEKEKSVNSLRTKLAVAEQGLKDKTALLDKQQELLILANEQKTRLEEAVADRERNLQRKQTSLQSVTDELVKANEIITKLQKELASVTAKLKVRTGIALEQEKVVESGRKKISDLEEQLAGRDRRLGALEEAESRAKQTIEELKTSIENKDKIIADNERVISWLNKRISEQFKETGNFGFNWGLNGNTSPTTSTPYNFPYRAGVNQNEHGAGVNHNEHGAHSFPAAGAPSEIERLDHVQTNLGKEGGNKSAPSHLGMDQGKGRGEVPAKNSSPSTQKTNETKSTSKTPSVGFRRLPPFTQSTTIPSSYFLK